MIGDIHIPRPDRPGGLRLETDAELRARAFLLPMDTITRQMIVSAGGEFLDRLVETMGLMRRIVEQ